MKNWASNSKMSFLKLIQRDKLLLYACALIGSTLGTYMSYERKKTEKKSEVPTTRVLDKVEDQLREKLEDEIVDRLTNSVLKNE